MEDNYNNKLRQKLAEQALYRKSGAALYIIFYCQLHSDIVTVAKNSTTSLFETVHKKRDVVGLLSILRSICVRNLSRSKLDPYLEQLKILSTTLSHVQIKGISNHNFGDAVYDQVNATQRQCGVFAFSDNYHAKGLSDDGNHSLQDFFSLDQAKKNKYGKTARELVSSRLIINNNLCTKTCTYLRDQYVVNQSNYPDTVVDIVAMIASFGTDEGDGSNKNTNEISEKIVSIHLANYGNKCSKQDDDGSVASFKATSNDESTSDDDAVPIADAPTVTSELENDNIDDNVVTSDDGDSNDDDKNDAGDMSGDDHDNNSSQEDSVSTNDNNNSTINPADADPPWMLLVAVADDDVNDDPDDYNEFQSDYDLVNDGLFDNDDVDVEDGYVCMTVTDLWIPPDMNTMMMISYYALAYLMSVTN